MAAESHPEIENGKSVTFSQNVLDIWYGVDTAPLMNVLKLEVNLNNLLDGHQSRTKCTNLICILFAV